MAHSGHIARTIGANHAAGPANAATSHHLTADAVAPMVLSRMAVLLVSDASGAREVARGRHSSGQSAAALTACQERG